MEILAVITQQRELQKSIWKLLNIKYKPYSGKLQNKLITLPS